MIPKVIHYCWFGHNPLPKLARRCIESWKKFLPDYEIKEWNEENFDVSIIPYTKDAYECKKYAFVSDYARFWILYHYGGVYFDTDVEVIKPMDEIINNGAFMGSEIVASDDTELRVAAGLGLACESHNSLYKDILNYYKDLSFLVDGVPNLTTVVKIVTDLLYSKGLKSVNEIQEIEGIKIYPAEYFAARTNSIVNIPLTENSYSVHHYMASWESPYFKFKKKLSKVLGGKIMSHLVAIKRGFIKLFK